ncbi:MAG: Dyp-type peroxidase [Mariprofundaceae bacterium]|nr:Dyp-type peroxidase [Mariprofundaceae bacterium]
MGITQPGILQDVPAQARYLSFSIDPNGDLQQALTNLAGIADGETIVVGIGKPVADALNASIPGLSEFPLLKDAPVEVPATNAALWCWLRGDDRGVLVLASRQVIEAVEAGLICDSIIDGFRYDIGRDLTGYEDGTENPKGADATDAAIAFSDDKAMNGSSFVAVQLWVHDLDDFLSRPQQEQDETIGRRRSDNEELEDAPETAHVKRTAQEDFDPEAFVLRRSMPWADAGYEGLVFVAFGKSFDAYEALLRRMAGVDDGQVDALFSFTTPVTGSYFWCPPIKNGSLNLKQLGL